MPSDKRARQRAGRQARMVELQRAQQRSKRNRRYLRIGAVVVAVLALAVYVGIRGSSKKKTTTTAAPKTTAAPTTVAQPTTTVAQPTTTGPTAASAMAGPSAASSTPASLAALTTRPAPPVSAACSAKPAAPSSAATTTVPAKGNAVSIVPAPAGVGFPSLTSTSPRYTSFTAPPPFCLDMSKTYTATMTTDLGTVVIKLFPQAAPQTVNNFVFLAGYHYFDGTVFHRVIPGFVDQGGDPAGTGGGGPGYTIPDEDPKAVAAYDDGAVAMAKTSAPNSGGSQFFLVVGTGGSQLQPSYADFGQITSGLNVAKAINADGDSTDNGSPPKITHKLLSVTIAET